MNFSPPASSSLQRYRCRSWTPLLTQQLRLRHLLQIAVYNLHDENSQCGGEEEDTVIPQSGCNMYYYTLHLTAMCAPFYTSEKCDGVFYPIWEEVDAASFPHPSASAFVIRIWKFRKSATEQEQHQPRYLADVPFLTWGVNLSGLVYLGRKFSDVQPESFKENTVILLLRGGYFTCYRHLRTDLPRPLPFVDHLNVVSTETDTFILRNATLRFLQQEVKSSYNLNKLRKIRTLQLTARNLKLDVESLSERIAQKCHLMDNGNSDNMNTVVESQREISPVRRKNAHSHLLTMTYLNKMLGTDGGSAATRRKRERAASLSKSIELARFRTKLLAQERDKLTASTRKLKQTLAHVTEENEEKSSEMMESYRQLSRDKESIKEWHRELLYCRDVLVDTSAQLSRRKRFMLSELLSIFPIEATQDNKYTINKIYLPDSKNLNDCSDDDLGVAFGYVAHVLLMLSWFLQAPLRYSIRYFGSRSYIIDHIAPNLTEKERQLPLFAKGIKDRMQFNYAVYLLNKNIAQLRWLCGQHTPDLHSTLPNLLALLKSTNTGDNYYLHYHPRNIRENLDTTKGHPQLTAARSLPSLSSESSSMLPHLLQLHQQQQRNSTKKEITLETGSESIIRPGLNEILAIPEAYMNKQISHTVFTNYVLRQNELDERRLLGTPATVMKVTTKTTTTMAMPSNSATVEQGTDILNSELNCTTQMILEHFDVYKESCCKPAIDVPEMETATPPSPTVSSNLDGEKNGYLQKWLETGPALVCSDETLYPEEILGTTESRQVCEIETEVRGDGGRHEGGNEGKRLARRTDALLSKSSFNLVKPK